MAGPFDQEGLLLVLFQAHLVQHLHEATVLQAGEPVDGIPEFGVPGEPADMVKEHHDPLLSQLDPHSPHEAGLVEGRLRLQQARQASFQRLCMDLRLFAKA